MTDRTVYHFKPHAVSFHDVQEVTAIWRNVNFPNATAEEQFMGMVEELGELSHAILKNKQGIRGMDDSVAFRAAVMDAVGDLMIFAAGFCDKMDIQLGECVSNAWAEVMERDWITAPDNGQLSITDT